MTTATGSDARSLIPGDPETLRDLHGTLQTFAQGFLDAANHLSTIGSGQEWIGQAAQAFFQQYDKHEGDYRTAGDAFATVLGPLATYADTLEWAQGQARRVIALQHEAALATQRWEAQQKSAPAGSSAGPDPGEQLRSQAASILANARQQVDQEGRTLGSVARTAADPAPKKPGFWSSAWHDVTSFVGGLGDSLENLGKFVWDFSTIRMLIDPQGYMKSLEGLGKGLWFGVQHPAEFGKAIIDWKDWSSGNWARALGELTPQIVIALLSGGAGAAAKGADAAESVAVLGETADAAETLTALEDGALSAAKLGDIGADLDASLGAADRAALTDYTGNNYTEINGFLRNPGNFSAADQADLAARSEAVSTALSKLPATAGTTFRGTTLPQSVLDSYEPGAVVSDNAFTSTSTNVDRAFDGNSLITITGQSGRDVAAYSQVPGESEVLYDSGTKFQVLSKMWDPELGKWQINLKEVP